MKKNIKTIGVFVLCLLIVPALIYADVNDYLILEDIGSYKLFTGIPGRVFSGPPSKYSQTATGGILDATGHFSENDQSYEASYTAPGSKWPFVKVEVTQHTGSDSDQWLLHEVEDIFRRNDLMGELTEGTIIREIEGNKILNWISYVWVSGNNVIYINWTPKPNVQNPEPLEIIQAYLQKFPSTIPATLVLDQAHNEQWIKDEMDRRLWLCDKWLQHLQAGKTDIKSALEELVDHMKVFLDYREKYYGMKAAKEKGALWEYLQAKDGTAIKNKLTEYKKWWKKDKDRSIKLP